MSRCDRSLAGRGSRTRCHQWPLTNAALKARSGGHRPAFCRPPPRPGVRPATLLTDVQLQKPPVDEHSASLQELRQLIDTLGWDIVGTLTQKPQAFTAASLIGSGKLDERSRESLTQGRERGVRSRTHADTSPEHQRATGVEVYDRPAVILEMPASPFTRSSAVKRGTASARCKESSKQTNMNLACSRSSHWKLNESRSLS